MLKAKNQSKIPVVAIVASLEDIFEVAISMYKQEKTCPPDIPKYAFI